VIEGFARVAVLLLRQQRHLFGFANHDTVAAGVETQKEGKSGPKQAEGRGRRCAALLHFTLG